MSKPTPVAPVQTTSDYLNEPLCLGEPDIFESLAVFPVLGPAPEQSYVSFAQGRDQGVTIKELETGASVNDIVIENPTDTPVLLFEGEEVLGAQQNRTFDVTVLAPRRSKLRIPVSCVEAGRWDGARHDESFTPAPQTADTELRRTKAERVRQNLEAGGPARADQGEVWDRVRAKQARLNVVSATGASHDSFERHRSRLEEFRSAIEFHDGQSGCLVAIGGRFVVLDWISRPEVFASLLPAVVQGYALDALEADKADPPSQQEAEGLLSLVADATTSERDGIGIGREVRFGEAGLIGTGLAAGTELVQLTVHNTESDGQNTPFQARAGRVRRPSRRLGLR